MLRLAGSAPLLVGLTAVVVWPTESVAQDITAEAKWEVDAHVGFITPGMSGGTSRAFPAADGFTTVTGTPSVAVSSWFFGAGAGLFNQATGAFIAPLDPALHAGITRRRGGINLGFAVARWLTPRMALEMQGDYAPSGLEMNQVTLAGLEQAATSYTDAWNQFLDAGLAADGFPFSVAVNGDAVTGGGHQFVLTGGVKVIVHTKRRFRSYVGGGAGISTTSTPSIDASLLGEYQFAANVPTPSGVQRFPFFERDEVSIRAELDKSRTFVGTVHGGFEYYTNSRRGFRVDVAVLLSPNRVSTLLNATPSVRAQEPGAAIAGTTSPTIQFSSHPASVTRSTLTGPSLRDIETFRVDGTQAQVKVSAAYFLRF